MYTDGEEPLDIIQQTAIRKKSFELHYNGGSIWCEHLDGMGSNEDEVIAKFLRDKSLFLRPSGSSFMIINLDLTDVTGRIVKMIATSIGESDKIFRKNVFVGVKSHWHKPIRTIEKKGISIGFVNDYEKAKEWLIP